MSRPRKDADEPPIVLTEKELTRWAKDAEPAENVRADLLVGDGEGRSDQGERGRHPKSDLPDPSGQRSWVCSECGASHKLVVPILHCHVCGRRR